MLKKEFIIQRQNLQFYSRSFSPIHINRTQPISALNISSWDFSGNLKEPIIIYVKKGTLKISQRALKVYIMKEKIIIKYWVNSSKSSTADLQKLHSSIDVFLLIQN